MGSAVAFPQLQPPRRRACGAAVAVCGQGCRRPGCAGRARPAFPVLRQGCRHAQHVDKLVISLLCRSCVLRGARRGEDSPIHSWRSSRKSLRSQRCSTRTMVDVPVVQVVVETAFSHSCFVEKLVENPRERVHLQRDHSAAGGGGMAASEEPSTTKSSSSSRAGRSLFARQARLFRSQ